MLLIATLVAGLLAVAGAAEAHTESAATILPICDGAFADGETTYVSGSCYDWGVTPSYTDTAYADNTAADAAEPPAPAPVTAAPPTWRNLYDWPNGHGYVGWYTGSSSQTGAYRAQAALGGQYGLWLWPAGGSSYSYSNDNYVEWTYTAPGTTRIANAQVLFAYRNKLLAHHCIDVGFRTGTTIVFHNEHCKPAAPPDSQRQVAVSLVDPSTNPTTKTLYFRIRVDCGGATTCSKNIPSLDPLSTGGFARLLSVDMTLVDDDLPEVAPQGEFWDLRDTYIAGARAYSLTVVTHDNGSGITRANASRVGTGELTAANAPCDPTHNTPALDNRICPDGFSYDSSIDTRGLPEGKNTFVAGATDVAHNAGSSPQWTVLVDRTPPTASTAFDVRYFRALAGTAGIGWESGEDPDLPDGTPGSGVDRFDYRYRVNGGSWIAAASQFPGFDLAGVAAGDVVDVEVTTLDVVGNASTASGSVTITADVDGDFVVADADLAPPGLPTLSAAQIQRALSLLASDGRVNAIAGNGYTVADVAAWAQGTGQLIGATVTVALGGERTLEADWPTVAYDATLDPPYEESVFHFRVAGATELEVLVDLNRGRVVGIAPLDGEESAGAFLAWRGTAGGQRVYSLRAMRRMQADEPPPENPEGRRTRTLHVKCFREDCFMNYDFGAKARTLGPSSKRVDWPIGTIYRGDAEVDKVKQGLRRAGFPYDGSAQWAFMNDGKGWVWDSNEGAKENKCSFFFKTAHTRVYADADDQLFNLRFGYYVLATQHFDAKECLKWGRWYGKSETAEHSIIHRLEEAKKNNNWDGFFDGWAFSEDQLPLNNREYGKIEDKRLENNGKASFVWVR